MSQQLIDAWKRGNTYEPTAEMDFDDPTPQDPFDSRTGAQQLIQAWGQGYGGAPKPRNPNPPSQQAASTFADYQDRLRSEGVEVPEQHQPSFLDNIMSAFQKPGQFGGTVASNILGGRGLGESLEAGKAAWDDPTKAVDQDRLTEQFGQYVPGLQGLHDSNGVGRFAANMLTGGVTDPLSYIGIGPTARGMAALNAADKAVLATRNVARGVPAALDSPLARRLANLADPNTAPSWQLHLAGQAVGPDLAPAAGKVGDVLGNLPGLKQAGSVAGSIFNTKHMGPGVERALVPNIEEGRNAISTTQRELAYYSKASIEKVFRDLSTSVPKAGAAEGTAVTALVEGLQGATPQQIAQHRTEAIQSYAKLWGPAAATQKAKEGLFDKIDNKNLQDTLAAIKGSTAPTLVKDTAVYLQTKMYNTAEMVRNVGIPINEIDNYIMHLYDDLPTFVAPVLTGWRATHKAQLAQAAKGATPTFTHQRIFPTTAEAISRGLHPITDARVSTAVHEALAQHALIKYRLGEQLRDMGNVISPLQQLTKNGLEWRPVLGFPGLTGHFAHPEVASYLDRLTPVLARSDAGVNYVRMFHQTAMHYFKSTTLATGGFLARIFTGDAWLNLAAGVNPLRYGQAAGIVTKSLKFVEIRGERVPIATYLQWFGQENLGGVGIAATTPGTNRLTAMAKRAGLDSNRNTAQRVGAEMTNFGPGHRLGPVDAFFEATHTVTNEANSLGRHAAFLHYLDSGFAVPDAAMLARRALFDYGELTKIEEGVRNYMIPFYAWIRNSLPRMLELLYTNPKMFSNTARLHNEAVRATGADESHLPDWLRESGGIPFMRDPMGVTKYMLAGLPAYDLATLHDPHDIQAIARTVASYVTPLAVIPMSIGSNQAIGTGQKITAYDRLPGSEEAMRDYWNYIKAALGGGFGRASNVAARFDQQQVRDDVRAAKGGVQEVKPNQKGFLDSFSPFNTQSEQSNARGDLYQKRDMAQQLLAATEARLGRPIATESELQKRRQPQGSAKSLTDAWLGYDRGKSSVPYNIGEPNADALKKAWLGGTNALKVPTTPSFVQIAVNNIKGLDDRNWEPYLALLLDQRSGGSTVYQDKEGRVGAYAITRAQFAQFKADGHDDIWNPVDNTMAAINMIKSQYGHPARIPHITTSPARTGGGL